VLVSDGIDSDLLTGLRNVLQKEGALLEVVAARIGGVEASDGSWIEADHTISGGPSVLYDAVALLVTDDATNELANDPAARDFVSDAFAHRKFVGYSASSLGLLRAVLGEREPDEGLIEIKDQKDSLRFVEQCRKLRFWEREAQLKHA
jgi:catalase